ncbi:MAG: DUF600 family protein [Gammaproteobacteria bacterium]|nr:DUF600 family protein [Gammaproteobacteria bacterium]
MNNPETITLNTNVVKEVAKSVSEPWERIVVHYEVLDSNDNLVQNELTIIVQKGVDNKHSVTNFVLSDQAKAALLKLRDKNTSESGDKWNTCVLIIDPPGKFKFDFSYDAPKILNGILDEDYKFYSKYLPHYLEEKGLQE